MPIAQIADQDAPKPAPPTSASQSAPTTRLGRPALTLARGPARLRIEQFIHQRYADAYGADLQHFMPALYGFRDATGALTAALGIRSAATGPLFLEQYLEAPIEHHFAAQFGLTPDRARIVEVGNLAGASVGALRQLIPSLTEFVYNAGYHWIAFTGAPHLCNAFKRLGLPLIPIGQATVDRIPEGDRVSWGRYYEQRPSVVIGDIVSAWKRVRVLQATPGAMHPVANVGAP